MSLRVNKKSPAHLGAQKTLDNDDDDGTGSCDKENQ